MWFLLNCVFLLASTTVYGNNTQNQDILDNLCINAQSSIEKVERGKVYLKPENLWLKQEQIYVLGEYGDVIRLPHLLSDADGFYLAKDNRTVIYICADCTRAYRNYKPDKCEVCWGTNFIVRFQ